jgi:hypothetical protein
MKPDDVGVRELATGGERVAAVAALLADPARHFPVFGAAGAGERGHA